MMASFEFRREGIKEGKEKTDAPRIVAGSFMCAYGRLRVRAGKTIARLGAQGKRLEQGRVKDGYFCTPRFLAVIGFLAQSEKITQKGGSNVNHPKKKEKVENVVEKSAAFSLSKTYAKTVQKLTKINYI
jgi:hypothetical protein